MFMWKSTIQIGNDFFQKTNYSDAEHQYIEACQEVFKLLQHWPDTKEAIKATLTSYNSLADCMKCQGKCHAALSVMQKAHELLDKRLKNPGITALQRKELLKGRRQASKQLDKFTQASTTGHNQTIIRGTTYRLNALQSA